MHPYKGVDIKFSLVLKYDIIVIKFIRIGMKIIVHFKFKGEFFIFFFEEINKRRCLFFVFFFYETTYVSFQNT